MKMDSYSDRMKSYEKVTRQYLPPRTYTIIRVDGRAFSTLTRHVVKPFDSAFSNAMMDTAIRMCQQISGVKFVYVQSDEISLLLTDFGVNEQKWFGGEVQKMSSVAASMASVHFNNFYGSKFAMFDGRVYTIPQKIEVANYFQWRFRDATRNAVSMAASKYFSHSILHGVNTAQMKEMLYRQHGIDFETAYNDYDRKGSVVKKGSEESPDLNLKKGGFLDKELNLYGEETCES